MNVFLLFLTVLYVDCVFSYDDQCKRGEVKSCYDSNIFDEAVPLLNGTNPQAICEHFLYWTEEIDENIQVTLTLTFVVMRIEGRTSSLMENCKKNELHKYNITARVKASEFEFEGNRTYDTSVKEVNILRGIVSTETKYTEITFIKQILDDIAGQNTLEIDVPPGKHRYYIDLEYVHPEGKYDCVFKIMIYSCWIRLLLFKVIGAVFGGLFLLSSIVCCPLIILACALLYCRNRLQKP